MSDLVRSVGVMETTERMASGEALAVIRRALDSTDLNLGLRTDAELLGDAHEALVLVGRLHAYAVGLLGEVHRRDAADHELHTTTGVWLTDQLNYTRREAARLIREAEQYHRFPQVAAGVAAGEVRVEQARAVTNVLTRLPSDLGPDAERAAEATMVRYCTEFDSFSLQRLSRHLLEVVAPEVVEQSIAQQLERDRRTARQNRHLSFLPDGHGSILLRGSLPQLEGELLATQVDALANQARRVALDAADPLIELEMSCVRDRVAFRGFDQTTLWGSG